ncbi:MAG TPA: hypothetical protein DCS93_08220 [Microscillaceae bacterium]|nr:hypothetical protein [Microscillaceae bacterium]
MNSQHLKNTRRLLLIALVMVCFAAFGSQAQAQSKKKFKQKTKAKTTAVTTAKPGQVLICTSKTTKTYHKKKCAGLARCKTKTSSLALAVASKTRKPCKICYPKGKAKKK